MPFIFLLLILAIAAVFYVHTFGNPFQKPTKLGDTIINLMKERPDEWEIDKYHARFTTIDMWIENRPYADMTMGGARVGNDSQRREMRRLIDDIRANQLINSIKNVKKK